jgi:hypothetical protein
MYCGQCGQQIDDDSRFCRHCGAAQTQQERPAIAETKAGAVDTPVESKARGAAWLGWAVGAFVVLVLIGILATPRPASPPRVESTKEAAGDLNAAAPDNLAVAEKPEAAPDEENWVYSTDEDKVRGSITYYARTTSTNRIHQDSPYDDETSMSILVRKSPAYGTDVILTISSGQMMCPSYEGCSGGPSTPRPGMTTWSPAQCEARRRSASGPPAARRRRTSP